MDQDTLFNKFFAKVTEGFNSLMDKDLGVAFENIIGVTIKIIIVIILTWILMKARGRLSKRIFSATKMDIQKQNTLSSIFLSFSKYIILIISGLIILEYLGVKTAPILASAGVLGVAIGFGAQNLVKDIISGFFILFEDWMQVGDYVQIGEISGTIEEIGLRSTVIREFSGKQVHLLNSSIRELVNFNRELMRPIVNFIISYEYQVAEVEKVIQLACDEINTKHEDKLLNNQNGEIVEPIHLYGVTDVDNETYGLKYTIVGLVHDQYYWMMGIEIRKIIIEYFRNNDIEIASPKRIYTAEATLFQK